LFLRKNKVSPQPLIVLLLEKSLIETDYIAHGVWTRLKQVEEALGGFSEVSKQDQKHKEFNDKTDYVRWILETSSPAYLSSTELDQTANELTSIASNLANNAANFGHYPHISNNFASILARLPYPRVKKIFRSDANEVIDEFRSTVLELQRSLTESVEKPTKQLSEIQNKSEELKRDADELRASLADLDHRIDAQITNYEARVSAQVTEKLTELSNDFSEAQIERSADFQQTENSIQEMISQMRSEVTQIQKDARQQKTELRSELAASKKDFESKANSIITDLNGLYDTAGQTALAAGFAGSAKEESVLFTRYSVLASVVFILVAILTASLWFSLSRTDNFSFNEMLMRLPVSAVFIVPGLYLASLASKHRKSAVKLRSLSLRIKAFDAYLANAPVEQSQELRSQLVREFFEEQPDLPTRGGISIGGGGKQTESLISLLEKSIEKIGSIKG
jgi:hypothetical protein